MNLLFLLASVGVVNGLLTALYLIFKKEKSVSDTFFAGLLFALCIRIGKSVLLYFFDEVDYIVLQIGLSACIFIGPFFYLYVKALRNQQQVFNRNDVIQLLACLVSILIVGSIYPYTSYPEYWNPEIVQGIYFIWAIYFVLGIREAFLLFYPSDETPNYAKSDRQFLITIVIGVTLITISYQLALYIGFTYIWGAFLLSFFFYFLGFRALFKIKPIVPQSKSKKVKNGEAILQQIHELMDSEKLYRNQELKLEDLAQKIGVSRHIISQVMNDEYGKGYSHYIKSYRIAEAKNLIQTRPELSLEGIGYEAGFKSKSVFFESFKLLAGSTPAAYKRRLND